MIESSRGSRKRTTGKACLGLVLGSMLVWGAVVLPTGASVAAPASTSAGTSMVKVAVSGPGQVYSEPEGIMCPGQCTGRFDRGAKLILNAKPASGSVFQAWRTGSAREPCELQTTTPCVIELKDNMLVRAYFAKAAKPEPTNSSATYDPATGKLAFRLKCGPQFKPKCSKLSAQAVAGKKASAKKMSTKVKATSVKAGKWQVSTLVIKKPFRQTVAGMAAKKKKTLWVRIQVTAKKKGKTVRQTVYHRYVVRKV